MDDLEKKRMIEERINHYERMILNLELDIITLKASGDPNDLNFVPKKEKQIEALKKAIEQIRGLMKK